MAHIEGVTEGRIVHYVLPAEYNRNKQIEHRGAMIVNAFGGQSEDGVCNLTVYLDGMNDVGAHEKPFLTVGSAKYSKDHEPGTWHWPERV